MPHRAATVPPEAAPRRLDDARRIDDLRAGRRLAGIDERLNEAKLDQLRAWGTGLSTHDSPDVRATGRAILLLIEEIERLHIDLWNAKSASADGEPEIEIESALELNEPDSLAQTLRERLIRRR